MALLLARAGDVDEAALARELAPLVASNLAALSAQDVQRIAQAVTDEQSRRLASSREG